MTTNQQSSTPRTVFESTCFEGKIVYTPATHCPRCDAGEPATEAFMRWSQLCRAIERLGPPAPWATDSQILEELTEHLAVLLSDSNDRRRGNWPCWCPPHALPNVDHDYEEVMP